MWIKIKNSIINTNTIEYISELIVYNSEIEIKIYTNKNTYTINFCVNEYNFDDIKEIEKILQNDLNRLFKFLVSGNDPNLSFFQHINTIK